MIVCKKDVQVFAVCGRLYLYFTQVPENPDIIYWEYRSDAPEDNEVNTIA